ncbi:MAG: fumarylacetoacetate hydrolase family protein [Gammaproteobacteria bacterium]|nr:MAG: fumarylacetoacetate hydrolase family protein [Gammaproteobacteria bacterium]
MKLGSLKSGGRDGTLVVVAADLRRAVAVPDHAATLQAALDDWQRIAPGLENVYTCLTADPSMGFAIDTGDLAAPLPRAYQWLDASAYLSHLERVRRARGADMPPHMVAEPLMYQGGSDSSLGPRDPIRVADEAWGVDFEAEIAVITDDVPMGVAAPAAGGHIKLLMLVNDVSLRNLIPDELAKGFGFVHGKPANAYSPVAVTPRELGSAWRDHRVHLPLTCRVNGETVGAPLAGVDLQFGFDRLIAHAARTRPLGAGTIIGAGTVSNRDASRGCACLIEKRVLELLETGKIATPFLKFGDQVHIEMRDTEGNSVFGAVDQVVTPA